MKNQKKWELLKFAYDNYPEGAKFYQIVSKKEIISSGKFQITLGNGCFGVCDVEKSHAVYSSDKKFWAEIVKPKIAVKVENEKEFKALMKYFKENKLFHAASMPEPYAMDDFAYGNCFTFHDKWFSIKDDDCDYHTIPFAEFSKEKGIKLPLITSVDGVDLYEGDTPCWVMKDTKEITLPKNILSECHTSIVRHYLLFSNEQAALSWIKAQKPKTKNVKMNNDVVAIVHKDEWVKFDVPVFRMSKNHLTDILNAMEELQK